MFEQQIKLNITENKLNITKNKLDIDKDIVRETNEIWGFEYMTALCMEEFAEVIQAVNKVRRDINSENIDHLDEEIADCLICIEQLEDLGIINKTNIKQWIESKQARQKARNIKHLIELSNKMK